MAYVKFGRPNNRSGGTKKPEAIFSRVLSGAENAERSSRLEKRGRVLAQSMKATPNNALKNCSLRLLEAEKRAAPISLMVRLQEDNIK